MFLSTFISSATATIYSSSSGSGPRGCGQIRRHVYAFVYIKTRSEGNDHFRNRLSNRAAVPNLFLRHGPAF